MFYSSQEINSYIKNTYQIQLTLWQEWRQTTEWKSSFSFKGSETRKILLSSWLRMRSPFELEVYICTIYIYRLKIEYSCRRDWYREGYRENIRELVQIAVRHMQGRYTQRDTNTQRKEEHLWIRYVNLNWSQWTRNKWQQSTYSFHIRIILKYFIN